MKLLRYAVFAAIGQALDVWSTEVVMRRGFKEGNPILRPLVQKENFGTLLAIKWGWTAAVAAYTACRASRSQRQIATAQSLRVLGIVGALACAWNLSLLLLHKRSSQP